MLIGINFSGCVKKVYIDVPKPYTVAVKCIVPNVDCNQFKHKGASIEEDLGMCIHELREVAEVCK